MSAVYKYITSFLIIGFTLSPLQASAFESCTSQVKKIAISTYGGEVYSASHMGNGQWNVTLIYSDGRFANVTIFPGCQ